MIQNFMLYNTKTAQKEKFVPLDENRIGIYVCGPTVYDKIHIGNARPIVVFDILHRVMLYHYKNKVNFVRNITDIDDKINKRAYELGVTIKELTEETTRAFQDECYQLYCLPPNFEPKATDHIEEILALIQRLLEKKHAYCAKDHVLFDVSTMPDYGKFARKTLDELIEGARVEVAPYKKHAADFVLWKPSDEHEPGWHSPYGYGRPGWHIECSAMSLRYLGKNFDIHAGGLDLIFPHHQNEIAQSCCAFNDSDFAKTWLHNGYVMVEGEKMSKSLGNFVTIHDLLKDHHGEVIRLSLLMTHYRQPLDFTNNRLFEAKNILDKAYRVYLKYADKIQEEVSIDTMMTSLWDDLNTPKFIKEWQKALSLADTSLQSASEAIKLGKFLGFFNEEPQKWFHAKEKTLSDEEITKEIQLREKARTEKNFAKADSIRDHLFSMGIILEDHAQGTSWRLK